jgi:hypothetical protein
MMKRMLTSMVVLLLTLTLWIGCSVGAPAEPAASTPTSGATAPAEVVSPTAPAAPDEAILILEPGPGSRLTSPIHVAGIADPTFEQNLVARLLLDDGSELALMPAQIQAELGQRGNFAVDIPFAISGERQAFLQVYATSARDGGVTHLASVGLTVADSEPENIIPVTPHPERIVIHQPAPGETISGGTAHVEGFGLASFEQTLLVEVVDEAGNVVGSQPVTVNAPELGQPGSFSVDVPYSAAFNGPGRIVVRDISPAFGGDTHRATVEVTLAAAESSQ